VLVRQLDDQVAMGLRQHAPQHDQTAVQPAREFSNIAFDLSGVAYAERAHLHPQRRRRALDCAQLSAREWQSGVTDDCHSHHAGRDLFKQLQPFRADAVFVKGKTSRVAARPRQAANKALADRVGDRGKHDGHRAACLLQRRHARACRGQYYVGRKRHQFCRVFGAAGVICGPAIVDPRISAGGPSQFLQTLQEPRETGLSFRIVGGHAHQHADAPHALPLLRARRKRPCRRAAEQHDEHAASHSITSSARASSVVGTSRPSALAVLRLIASSYFTGACTGRSAGFSPLRMRSTYSVARRTGSSVSGP
jgi:hypothetical protein